MKIGIVSTAYLDRYGVREGAIRLQKHGYSSIDYQGFISPANPEFSLPEAEFSAALREKRTILSEFGIDVCQAHGDWRHPVDDATPERRAERFASMAKAIRGCAYLGAPYMVIHPIMPFGANSPAHPETMRDINLDFYTRLSEVGREWGVTVCLENMPFPSLPITTPAQIADFVREVHSPYFRVCLDTGHALCLGIPLDQAVDTVEDLLSCIHVHDNDGSRDQHTIPGTGVGDFSALISALKRNRYSGVFCLETAVAGNVSGQAREEAERALAQITLSMAE